MNYIRPVFTIFLFLASFAARSQTLQLIGTSEQYILENVKGYDAVEEQAIEHEEFNVLVFEDKDRELSFYFTFFRGDKVCNYIKKKAPVSALKEEIAHIKSTLKSINEKTWENAEKTVQVEISETDGNGLLLIKWLR